MKAGDGTVHKRLNKIIIVSILAILISLSFYTLEAKAYTTENIGEVNLLKVFLGKARENNLRDTTELNDFEIDLIMGLASGYGSIYNTHGEYIHHNTTDENIENKASISNSAYINNDDILQNGEIIDSIKKDRLNVDRLEDNSTFYSLREDVRSMIKFFESILIYNGSSEEYVDNFYKLYLQMLGSKSSNEYIVEEINGEIRLKDEYRKMAIDAGFMTGPELSLLARLFSYDRYIYEAGDILDLIDTDKLPYEINKTSKLNMMLAGSSLVGKVRYVWGGGHNGASTIDGINPVWELFEKQYSESDSDKIRNSCIRPKGSWCPIHGYSDGDCTFNHGTIKSLDRYIEKSQGILQGDEVRVDRLRELIEESEMDFRKTTFRHNIDGLDCSGFVSWVYNQITDEYQIDSTAMYFGGQRGIERIKFGSSLQTGDVFAWSTHIVMIVGQMEENPNFYITLESVPNKVKFGVVYYSGNGQTNKEIEYGKESAVRLAKEANTLIGGMEEDEEVKIYCMNSISGYKQISRFKGEFEEDIPEYNEDGTEIEKEKLYAQDIIQEIVNSLPYNYLDGFNKYNGELIDKNMASTNLKKEIDENQEEQEESSNKEVEADVGIDNE